MEIGYMTELAAPYIEGLKACQSKEELIDHVGEWSALCSDAMEQLKAKDFSFSEFQAGCMLERSGSFAGLDFAKRYGAILMPEILMAVALLAGKYKVPDGLMFIRLQEAGALSEDVDGVWHLDKDVVL